MAISDPRPHELHVFPPHHRGDKPPGQLHIFPPHQRADKPYRTLASCMSFRHTNGPTSHTRPWPAACLSATPTGRQPIPDLTISFLHTIRPTTHTRPDQLHVFPPLHRTDQRSQTSLAACVSARPSGRQPIPDLTSCMSVRPHYQADNPYQTSPYLTATLSGRQAISDLTISFRHTIGAVWSDPSWATGQASCS